MKECLITWLKRSNNYLFIIKCALIFSRTFSVNTFYSKSKHFSFDFLRISHKYLFKGNINSKLITDNGNQAVGVVSSVRTHQKIQQRYEYCVVINNVRLFFTTKPGLTGRLCNLRKQIFKETDFIMNTKWTKQRQKALFDIQVFFTLENLNKVKFYVIAGLWNILMLG